jgi:hypothetical protein
VIVGSVAEPLSSRPIDKMVVSTDDLKAEFGESRLPLPKERFEIPASGFHEALRGMIEALDRGQRVARWAKCAKRMLQHAERFCIFVIAVCDEYGVNTSLWEMSVIEFAVDYANVGMIVQERSDPQECQRFGKKAAISVT